MTPEALADLHGAAFVQGRPWSASEFRDLLDGPHCRLTCTSHGFALWRAIAGEAELLTIAVRPDQQGRGVGTALMRDWMAAAAQHADTAFLEVAADNLPACALYTRHGFEIVARRPGYYRRGEARADALVMRAPLPFPACGESAG
ncbi:GNAT family N-acetyltransferase [Tateyamaria sp. SN3-11]|uniref:GNAT family N-acetyltransferase n=1 Tax=Tateyamaria sp. SN3-11 TaxID=3092147 RepID=UPI0039E9B140